MGLDVSHDCWHGSYSAFNRFRNLIASKTVGLTRLPEYEGQERQYWREYPDIDDDVYTAESLTGMWDECPDEPLMILFCHSDCDGIIKHEHTYALAQRLTEVLPDLVDEKGVGHFSNPLEKTQQFIDGLMAAFEAGEDVRFH